MRPRTVGESGFLLEEIKAHEPTCFLSKELHIFCIEAKLLHCGLCQCKAFENPPVLVIGVILPDLEGLHNQGNGCIEDFDMLYQTNLFSLPAPNHQVIVCVQTYNFHF